ncbi:hypothetical protein E2C01_079765 [Portunus trituberculatus]|uniref:Uncharacterized protein n=1 Tax=Portunus trituberculatus TaxID=210409 RepID=A0A5B7IU73_PORTR|nr:hypothetical protein [Portunus trituberculatus]
MCRDGKASVATILDFMNETPSDAHHLLVCLDISDTFPTRIIGTTDNVSLHHQVQALRPAMPSAVIVSAVAGAGLHPAALLCFLLLLLQWLWKAVACGLLCLLPLLVLLLLVSALGGSYTDVARLRPPRRPAITENASSASTSAQQSFNDRGEGTTSLSHRRRGQALVRHLPAEELLDYVKVLLQDDGMEAETLWRRGTAVFVRTAASWHRHKLFNGYN